MLFYFEEKRLERQDKVVKPLYQGSSMPNVIQSTIRLTIIVPFQRHIYVYILGIQQLNLGDVYVQNLYYNMTQLSLMNAMFFFHVKP